MRNSKSDILNPRSEEEKGINVLLGDRIDEIGFGAYQVHVWILCSGMLFVEGAILQMASGLIGSVSNSFEVTTYLGNAMIMAWLSVGLAVGALSSGPLGDGYGRRLPVLLGYCGIILVSLCTFDFVQSLYMLYVMRFFFGFFAGIGLPTACICISEVSPSTSRNSASAALGLPFIFGSVWSALGLMIWMPDLVSGNARVLVLWPVFPAVFLLMFAMITPVTRLDTPYYLGCKGRATELRQALNLMAEMNGKPHLVLNNADSVICHTPKETSSSVWWTMFRPPLVGKLAIMCFMMFAKEFSVFGSYIFWPSIWTDVAAASEISPSRSLMVTCLLGIPGCLLAIVLNTYIPRKVCLMIAASLCSLCVILLKGLSSVPVKPTAYVGVVALKLLAPSWQVLTLLLPSELFPTEVRASAFAFSSTMSRGANILAPFAIELGTDTFTTVLAALVLGVALVTHFLPETKDVQLAETEDDSDASAKKLCGDRIEAYSSSYGAATTARV